MVMDKWKFEANEENSSTIKPSKQANEGNSSTVKPSKQKNKLTNGKCFTFNHDTGPLIACHKINDYI